MNYNIVIIPGDGIGNEITEAAMRIMKTMELDLEFNFFAAGDNALEEFGNALPDETMVAASSADAILKGPFGESARLAVLPLRQNLGLYANLRPARNLPGIDTRLKSEESVDLLIVRENTEGLYSMIGDKRDEIAYDIKVCSEVASRKIMETACELAKTRRKKITIVHKANVLKSDMLFRDTCNTVSEKFPELIVENMYVDNCAYQLVRDPTQFDVIVTQNLYGDILSDEASWVQGGLGFSPCGNLSDDQGMFEPVHGAAFDIVGNGIANPTAMILSMSMMFQWLGKKHNDFKMIQCSNILSDAIDSVLQQGQRTRDVGGNLSTTQYTDKIITEINQCMNMM